MSRAVVCRAEASLCTVYIKQLAWSAEREREPYVKVCMLTQRIWAGVQEYTDESRAFMDKIIEQSGVGEQTYMPEGDEGLPDED